MELTIPQPGPVIEVPQTDLVLGAVTGYTWDQIEPWAVSLERSGYKGKKALIAYDMDFETAEKLTEHEFSIMAFKKDDERQRFVSVLPQPASIVTFRFLHYWMLLNSMPYENFSQFRYVIATDVKDVVFQTNPSDWLQDNLYPFKINVGGEGLTYANEAWGNDNLRKSFGDIVYNTIANRQIVNAGTFAGEAHYMKDLFFHIWLLCQTNPMVNPDQAALNILLSMKPWNELTRVNNHVNGWCCQCGTVADPNKMDEFGPNLLPGTPEPHFDPITGTVYVRQGSLQKFCLVHQYDRNQNWRPIIDNKYRDSKKFEINKAAAIAMANLTNTGEQNG